MGGVRGRNGNWSTVRILVAVVAVGSACEEPTADPCAGVTCTGHGECTAAGGAPFCHCDWGYEPVELECVREGARGFIDDFDVAGAPDPSRWALHDFTTGNAGAKSVSVADGRLSVGVETTLYAAAEEYGVRSVPYFLVQSDSELVIEVTTRPPQPEAGGYPATIFLSDDVADEQYVHVGCAGEGCGSPLGRGKRGFGLRIIRSSPAFCGLDAQYEVIRRSGPDVGAYEILESVCSHRPGTTDFRAVRLEVSVATVQLIENGEVLGSWPNPVPGMAGGHVFLVGMSDQPRYPDLAEFEDVRVFCKGRCEDLDFSADPGWTATTPERCGWNDLDGGVMEVTNFIQSEDVCATYVDWTGGAFTLEYDFMLTLLGWAAEWRFGLWDDVMDVENSQRVAVGLGCVDGGGLWHVLACNKESQTYVTEYRPPPFDDCVLPDPGWMTVRIDYAGDSVHAVVRARLSGEVLHEETIDEVECTVPLTRLGFSMVGFLRPAYGEMYSVGYLDNVRFTQR